MIFEPPEPFFGVPHSVWRDMCEAFQVEDFALMIRATRGRSINQSIDGSVDGSIDQSVNGLIVRSIHRLIEDVIIDMKVSDA